MDRFEKYITPNMLNLTDTYAVKILICYFLKQMSRPITPDQLTEIATADGIVNYFIYMEAMNQMLESGTIILVEKDGKSWYKLSEIGELGATSFKRLVPKSFRDKILSSGLKFFAKMKNDNDVKIEIEQLEKGCSVNCVCKDGKLTLLEMKLFAPDMEQAQLVAERIKNNPADFYGKVIDYAISNEEYEPDISDIE